MSNFLTCFNTGGISPELYFLFGASAPLPVNDSQKTLDFSSESFRYER